MHFHGVQAWASCGPAGLGRRLCNALAEHFGASKGDADWLAPPNSLHARALAQWQRDVAVQGCVVAHSVLYPGRCGVATFPAAGVGRGSLPAQHCRRGH